MPKPQPTPIDPKDISDLARAVMQNDRFPFLATVEGDQPRLRPVSPVRTDGFVVYVANLRMYAKTAQIAANPKVELCYMDDQHKPGTNHRPGGDRHRSRHPAKHLGFKPAHAPVSRFDR